MLKAQKRITKRELKHDPLLDTVYTIRGWWQANKRQVNRYGSIALVVIVISILVFRWRSGQERTASAVVGIAMIEFERTNYNTVIAQLTPHIDGYIGLKAFDEGLLILARSELFAGDTSRSEEHFKLYLDEYGAKPILKAGAMAGLGIIYESRGDHSGAARYFRDASRTAPNRSFKLRYAIYAAYNYLKDQKPEEALRLLKPILEKEPVTFQFKNEIEELVAQAEMMARLRSTV